ncbi:MAG: endonuclease/exonuclease/phosphatase family protein [Bdellovibrionales bacterium]
MGKRGFTLILLSALLSTSIAQAKSFKVVVFNIQKAENAKWDQSVFDSLVSASDLSLLQESVDDLPMEIGPVLNQYFYKSWGNSDYDTGLETRTVWQKKSSRVLFSPTNEPVSDTPKISVVELYDIEGCEDLMVVNTHGINFRGFSHFRKQMKAVFENVRDHQGPMIWAGDFNTRNTSRKKYLISIAKDLSLKEIKFEGRTNKGFALDRAFSRGLEVLKAEEIQAGISDHEPLYIELEKKN